MMILVVKSLTLSLTCYLKFSSWVLLKFVRLPSRAQTHCSPHRSRFSDAFLRVCLYRPEIKNHFYRQLHATDYAILR